MRLLVLLFLFACSRSAPAQPVRPADDLDRLVHDVCGKQIVLLGEATHGDGRTFATKAALMRRLVDECGFGMVVFEAGIYDFVGLEPRFAAHTATREQVGDAIGPFWSSTQEMDPWIADLFARASAGTLRLAGLDVQIGITHVYAQNALPARLAGDSPCAAELARFTTWGFDDAHPFDDAARARMHACLAEVRRAAPPGSENATLAASLELGIDLATGPTGMFDLRDKAMFDNLAWHASRAPANTKIVVWCHSLHAAKDAANFKDGGNGLGAYIHRAYGERAAAIAFSALGGSYAMVRHTPSVIAPAAADSLEARAFATGSGDIRYLDRAALAQLGAISARPLQYVPTTADWSKAFDGFVVFREEKPPTFVRGVKPQQN